jgi:magnesium transporter
VNPNTTSKIIFKEMRVGLSLGVVYGVALGAVAFIMSYLIESDGYSYNLVQSIELSIAIALGILIAMVLATFTGTIAPIILNKIKIDPAIATGPFVTTTIDILGILIYLLIATALVQI